MVLTVEQENRIPKNLEASVVLVVRVHKVPSLVVHLEVALDQVAEACQDDLGVSVQRVVSLLKISWASA